MEVTAAEGRPGGATVAGRYRIDKRIARGGMGEVYRAVERTTSRPIALKRLRADVRDRKREQMFEREYRTLRSLDHPRIIEVYDFGVDPDGPYYTMELLDGSDLRELAPLPYMDACRYLRDVASSLALLHARRLIHRDLSPRNVRITTDGRAKLLDFGALAGFGRSATLVGTPPCVPPEALQGAALDQRADLFSLGALAYWVLTGRHAFEARELSELPAVWQREPPPPSQAMPRDAPELAALPPALDALVLSLLSRNPLARPSSAAEVIARLSAIAGLPPDREPLSARSYLRGGRTVGRARERAELRRRLKAATTGAGAAVVIEAEEGMGVGRILEDLAVEAELLGATPVIVDAGVHDAAYGVVKEIARVLDERLGAAAWDRSAPEWELLCRFAPDVDGPARPSRTTLPTDVPPADPREHRLRTQEALRKWLEQLCSQTPIFIGVMRAHRADDASAALIATLARGAAERKLLVCAGRDPTADTAAPGPLSLLRECSSRLRLRGLARREVVALVEASFGKVANTERLCEWLLERTGGNPRACLDLIHHLVDSGVIRFVEGVWSLPQELSPAELPADSEQALASRIGRLGEDAHRLARALSIHRGAVARERCLAIAADEGIGRPAAALDELEWADILVSDGEAGYHFRHGGLREVLLRQMPKEERQRLHRSLGRWLASRCDDDPDLKLEAGWHLLQGGEQIRGAELLIEAGTVIAHHGERTAALIGPLEAALQVLRREGRPARVLGPLLATLAIAGFHADRRALEAYGPEAVDALERLIGLPLVGRLRPFVGRRLALYLALGTAVLRLAPHHGPLGAARELTRLITLFATLVTVTVGLGVLTFDATAGPRYLSRLEPLTALGRRTAPTVTFKLSTAISKIPEDRVAQVLRELDEVLAMLEDPSPIAYMPDDSRLVLHGAALYAKGALETFRDSPEALDIADRVEGLGWKIFSLFANQIRANHYAVRGDIERAQHFRAQVELCALQAGSGWQAEVWSAPARVLAYRIAGDVIGLKRASEELDRLARAIPSMSGQAALAHASYHMTRGDYERSREFGSPVTLTAEPRGFIGYASAVGADVRTGVLVADPEKALELGRETIALYDSEDRQVCALFAQLVADVAFAEAHLGEPRAAAERIDAYLKEVGARAGPTTLGYLHMERARIALLEGDLLSARLHLAHIDKCYQPTRNPSLIGAVEALRRDVEAAEESAGTRTPSVAPGLGSADIEQARLTVERCPSRNQRFEAILALLIERAEAACGYLFVEERGKLDLAAPEHGREPAPGLLQRVAREIAQHAVEQSELTAVTDRARSDVQTRDGRSAKLDAFSVFLLSIDESGREVVVAAAALANPGAALRPLPPALLRALADCLRDSGDVTLG